MSRPDRGDLLAEALCRFLDRHDTIGVWIVLLGCFLFLGVFTYVAGWLATWLGGLLHQFLLPYFPCLPPPD